MNNNQMERSAKQLTTVNSNTTSIKNKKCLTKDKNSS